MSQLLPIGLLGLGPGGALDSGLSASQAASYQSQVAKNNAIVAHQNAVYTAESANVKAEQQGLKARAQTGQIRTAIGANNLDVNTGSPADVQTSQRELGFLDTSTATSNEALKTYGYNVQQENFQEEAQLESMESENDIAGGVEGAANSLLGQANNLPNMFSWMAG